jgi:hypothetical protein
MTDGQHPSVPNSIMSAICPFHVALQRGMKHLARAGQPLWKMGTWACEQMNVRCEVTQGELPGTGPTLVIFNDPSPVVGFVMFGAIRRDDFHFIGNPGWKKIGGRFAEFGFPVYSIGDFKNYPKEFIRAHTIYRFRDGVPPKAAGRKNVQALVGAASAVSKGGLLAVAPAGGTIGKSDNWKHGVGHILEKIRDPGAKVILTRVDGLFPRDAARILFNPSWFASLRKPLEAKIRFSEPIPIGQFRGPGLSAKDMSLRLRDAYVQYFGSL